MPPESQTKEVKVVALNIIKGKIYLQSGHDPIVSRYILRGGMPKSSLFTQLQDCFLSIFWIYKM